MRKAGAIQEHLKDAVLGPFALARPQDNTDMFFSVYWAIGEPVAVPIWATLCPEDS